MTESGELCTCVGSPGGEGNNATSLCPQCGKKIPAPKQFSDSMLEATYEILAEEGAISKRPMRSWPRKVRSGQGQGRDASCLTLRNKFHIPS